LEQFMQRIQCNSMKKWKERMTMIHTVKKKNRIAMLVVFMLAMFALSIDGMAYHHRHYYHHHSKTKGAVVGGLIGGVGGALVGGKKGAVIGAGAGAGTGYLVQRHRNRHHRHYRY